jgi:hypothetical protein
MKHNFYIYGEVNSKVSATVFYGVLWETEDEIAELLFKCIEATIGKGK